jgi:hypothetical protein
MDSALGELLMLCASCASIMDRTLSALLITGAACELSSEVPAPPPCQPPPDLELRSHPSRFASTAPLPPPQSSETRRLDPHPPPRMAAVTVNLPSAQER